MTGPGMSTWGGTISISTGASVRADAGETIALIGPLFGFSTGVPGLTKRGEGEVLLSPQLSFGVIHVQEGAVRLLPSNATPAGNRLYELSIEGGATPSASFDLGNHSLIVQQGDVALLSAQVRAARNSGGWDQPGLTSVAAASDPTASTTIGVLRGLEYRAVYGSAATLDGFAVADTDVLLKYTLYGDSDFNGIVNFDDYARIDNGFSNGGTTWFQGDFDLNNAVNFDDYALIDLAFNTQSGTLARVMDYLEGEDRSMRGMDHAALQIVVDHFNQFGNVYATSFLSSVPEPTSVVLVAASAVALVRRRRHV
jgi:hypothetical protein